jgi:hypothetical protein
MLCMVMCGLQLACGGMLGGGSCVIFSLVVVQITYTIVWYKIWLFLTLLTVILDYHGSLGVLEM